MGWGLNGIRANFCNGYDLHLCHIEDRVRRI